jgi:hypothetical protein
MSHCLREAPPGVISFSRYRTGKSSAGLRVKKPNGTN